MLQNAKLSKLAAGLLISFCLLSTYSAFGIEVYGYVAGSKKAQPLTLSQVQSLQRLSHGGVPTWLAVVSELNTSSPKVHIIDQDYFDTVESKYGTHQAYCDYMGITKGATDYIKRLKAEGRPRYFMPYTLYIRSNGQWVLQNRRYVFKDNSANFAASLIKSQDTFQRKLSGMLSGNAAFVTYQAPNSHHRPNTETAQGLSDIEALNNQGFDVITEDNL